MNEVKGKNLIPLRAGSAKNLDPPLALTVTKRLADFYYFFTSAHMLREKFFTGKR